MRVLKVAKLMRDCDMSLSNLLMMRLFALTEYKCLVTM